MSTVASMFLFRLIFSPVRIAFAIARFMGFSRTIVFLLGVAVGLLAAPTTGAELRARLMAEVEARRNPGPPPPPSDLVSPRASG